MSRQFETILSLNKTRDNIVTVVERVSFGGERIWTENL